MRVHSPANLRVAAFLLLCVTVVAAIAGYTWWSRSPGQGEETPALVRMDPDALEQMQQQPFLLFRNSDLGPQHGTLFLSPIDHGDTRYVTPLTCDRVHFAGGNGVCLVAARGARTTYRALTFDSAFVPRHSIALGGVPSRVRVAPDGRRAGITVFVTGDSYAVAGNFSTRTIILDVETGKQIGQLETYAISRSGQPFKAVDFNFWGVTFADRRRFFATLGTGGRTYLIEADADTRTGTVIHEDVECPSLSPDGTRVAFKKRETDGGRLVFRLHVLDLTTNEVVALSETRSVDDQVEWLDDTRIVYGLASESRAGRTDLWSVPADSSGAPRPLLENGWSPAAVRPGTR